MRGDSLTSTREPPISTTRADKLFLCASGQVIDLDSQNDTGDAKGEGGAPPNQALSDRQRELRLHREIYMMMGSSLLGVGRDAGGDKAYQMFATDLWIHPRYVCTDVLFGHSV